MNRSIAQCFLRMRRAYASPFFVRVAPWYFWWRTNPAFASFSSISVTLDGDTDRSFETSPVFARPSPFFASRKTDFRYISTFSLNGTAPGMGPSDRADPDKAFSARRAYHTYGSFI